MTNVLTVAVDAGLVDRINAIRGHQVMAISRDNVASVREHPDVSFHPDLILVGTGITSPHALQYARGVLEADPTMAVMLVAEPDRELIRQATQIGVRGVIRPTINDRELAGLLKRTKAHSPVDVAEPARHQVIVVASPKGGVGKTTTAVNLAALLAEFAPGEVVLLDLDLQFGDVSTFLDLHPEYTVADALGPGGADSMLLRTLLISHPANFYVLCGADHPAGTGQVTGDQIRKLVSQFSTAFRYVVVDTSAGLYEETLASLEEATDVVFVATLDVATLRNVRKEVDVLAELGLLPEHRHVVLNRTDRMSGLTANDVESILGMPAEALIPASNRVPLAANHGRLAVLDKKKNTIRRPLRQFARIVAGPVEQPGRPTRPTRSGQTGPTERPASAARPGRHR